MRAPNSQAGFSILEIFVSITLLLVFAGVAAPKLTEYNRSFQLQAATDRLKSEIGRARMQAMAQNIFVRMSFNEAGNLVTEESQDGLTYTAAGTAIKMPSGIAASFSGISSLVFDSTGVASTAATITVEGAGTEKSLYTNILGRVTAS